MKQEALPEPLLTAKTRRTYFYSAQNVRRNPLIARKKNVAMLGSHKNRLAGKSKNTYSFELRFNLGKHIPVINRSCCICEIKWL